MNASQYTYEVMWSKDDRAFIARVVEFPSLVAHGSSRGSSLRQLRGVVDAVVKDLANSGEDILLQNSDSLLTEKRATGDSRAKAKASSKRGGKR